MKTVNITLVVKLEVEDTETVNLQHISEAVDRGIQGTFGSAMWDLGNFVDCYVSRVVESSVLFDNNSEIE